MSASSSSAAPLVTAVISTRNRGANASKAVQTILLNDYPSLEVIVVDQSENGLTKASMQPFLGDPRIRYIVSPTKGVSAGRNIGLGAARGELAFITDDDCEATPNCLRELADALEFDSRIGVVFGNVLPANYDRAAGFIPAYVRSGPGMARSIREKHLVEGISACMGLRRSVWHALGGFDPMLGAGAPFRSAAETDFTIRALLAGYFVYETPSLAVIHRGFRTWEEGQPCIQGYLYGIGAMLAKHLKCGYWSVVHVLFRLAQRWAFGRPVVDLGDRSHKWLRLLSFIRGFVAGAVTPVDRATGHYSGARRKQ